MTISLDDIQSARERLDDPSVVRRLPVDASQSLSEMVGAAVGDLDVGEAYLVFKVITSGRGQAENTVAAIEEGRYEVERVN